MVDSDDTVHLVYSRSADGPLQEYRLQYTRRRLDAGEFGEPRPLPDDTQQEWDSAHYPELGLNGSLQGLFTQKLAVNTAGQLAVANSTFARNEQSAIRVIEGSAR